MKKTGGLVAALFLLAACGGPEKDATYDSVEALRDAAIEAGYECPNWEQRNQVTAAAQSGSCSTADVFATYLSEAARDEAVNNLKAFAADFDDMPVTVLAGPNWTINAPDEAVHELHEKLGGTVVGG
ncbi:hypothetical protein [Naumannella halotolerans]|uniref:Lipoprotein n=1 Tax=Naumannella halotolerans TaxID=993414 RepID=A0A4R7J248_9ACTN|nr:hypothetical protein [Naumannella halotolerans]TDT31144.1 hypothetical protein CLV29_2557 [Naumannella halotolerans]